MACRLLKKDWLIPEKCTANRVRGIRLRRVSVAYASSVSCSTIDDQNPHTLEAYAT